jgi:ABC-type transport system involved in multi-copper enzyme maturation permease subunit
VIRFAWRQLRLAAIIAAALLAAAAVTMLVTHRQMTAYADSSGLTSCLNANVDCGLAVSAFEARYSIWLTLLGGLAFLPMLAGLFLGAPLIAREFEQGTHRLVWTQSISRGRWLATKLAMIIIGLIAIAAAATVCFTLWARIWSTVDRAGYSRIQPPMFGL